MQTTFKRIAAALLISLSLGLSGTAMAQAIAPINVNSADEELLAELPGIGPSRDLSVPALCCLLFRPPVHALPSLFI